MLTRRSVDAEKVGASPMPLVSLLYIYKFSILEHSAEPQVVKALIFSYEGHFISTQHNKSIIHIISDMLELLAFINVISARDPDSRRATSHFATLFDVNLAPVKARHNLSLQPFLP